MSHFEILYLFFRTIEVEGNDKAPQYQIFLKHDPSLPFKEENPRTIVKVKAVPQTELRLRLVIHQADNILTLNNSIFFKDLNLTPFEPKTFSLTFKTEDNKKIYFIFDAFSYYITPEETLSAGNPLLFDLDIHKLLKIDHLVEKVEKPVKKKRSIGFSMVEFELVFEYLRQSYSFRFATQDPTNTYRKNVFVSPNTDVGNLKVKLLAYEYEWFVEGQSKALKATRTLGESSISLKEVMLGGGKPFQLKLLGDFGFEYSVIPRQCPYMKNFIGHLDFRVLSTTFFKETITNPNIVLRQLGSNIQWTIQPYSLNKRNNEFVWDFEYERTKNEFMKQAASIEENILEMQNLVNKKSDQVLQALQTNPNPEVKRTLDFLYQLEDDENNLEKESLNFAYQRNGAFFYSSVPNETIVLEVYQNGVLLGYSFFPLANINLDQNFSEKIFAFGTDGHSQNLGEAVVRVEFRPINVGINQNLFNKLTSLDFDDISERFEQASRYHEACFLMDKNIETSKELIWPKRITNMFSEIPYPKRFILNLKDIMNLSAIFTKDTNLNDFEIKVRISDVQQSLKFNYTETTLYDLKSNCPKEYFLFTEAFYKQVLIEDDESSTVMFRLPHKKEGVGVVTVPLTMEYRHFEFTVTHPKESCSISLLNQQKVVDYQIFTMDSIPIMDEVDSLLLPFQVPIKSDKILTEKAPLFLKFETMSYPEEEMTGDFTSGVFVLQRIKTKYKADAIDKADLKANYDLEIQTPQGLIHKVLNLGNDITVDRTYFEHLAEIRKEEGDTLVKLIMRKIIKTYDANGNESTFASDMPIIFETEFTLKASDGTEGNDEGNLIKLKPNYGTERKISVKDNIGEKSGSTDLDFNFRFVFKANKFIDSPEGVLSVRLLNSEVESLRQTTPIGAINSLKVYISDAKKQIGDNAAFIFMERSLDDVLNQPKIQTYDWTNKLIVEAYGSGEVLLSRTLIHLSDIPFINQQEVIKTVVLNGARVNFFFGYTSILGEDGGEDGSFKVSRQNQTQGGQNQKGVTAKNLGIVENLKQRIKDLEKENLVLRTNVSKTNVIYTKKMKAIEKLESYNSNFEESKKAYGQEGTNRITLPSVKINSKLKELYNSICQCGKPAPKFKGFCDNCLKNLKNQYEKTLQEYLPVAEQYESIATKKHNIWKKRAALEKKIQTYEKKAKEFNFDFIVTKNEEEEMLKDEAKGLKAKLLEKRNEIEIIQQEHYFKIEEMKAKQKILETLLEEKTKKLDKLLSSSPTKEK